MDGTILSAILWSSHSSVKLGRHIDIQDERGGILPTIFVLESLPPVGTNRFDLKPDVHELCPLGIMKNVHIFVIVEDDDQVVPMYRKA